MTVGFLGQLSLTTWINVIIALFTTIAAFAAWRQSRIARQQADFAKRAYEQTYRIRLFDSFDTANQLTVTHPDLLIHVHGLKEVDALEARNIAYLSILLDGYQHYYMEHFDGDFRKFATQLTKPENREFLNRVLSVPENWKRWELMKRIYYAEFDREFVAAIDAIIAFEKQNKDM